MPETYSMPDRDRVAGGAAREITAAFTQVMSSLEDLAKNCRAQGIDPMTMLMRAMSGSAGRGGPNAGPQAIYVEALSAPTSVPTPSDAELIKRSHDLVDALDRGDVATVAAALAPGFVRFVDGAAIDRDAMLLTTIQRRSMVPDVESRSWDDDSVVRKDDMLVFMGKAHEVLSGNRTKGGYIHDGWYLLQWVRACGAWRVQLLTWQKEATERDRFNDIFRKGRGFSREPNRLLVEVVRDEKPGAALELATGQGRNALYLAAQGWNVTGVDGSDEGLRIARQDAVKRELALETINADIDEWDLGVDRFDLVTLIYAGDHANWIDKIKASLRNGGLFVVEGWAKVTPDNPVGFGEGQLAKRFDGYEILRDETVEDVPDWAWDKGRLVRFVARKR